MYFAIKRAAARMPSTNISHDCGPMTAQHTGDEGKMN